MNTGARSSIYLLGLHLILEKYYQVRFSKPHDLLYYIQVVEEATSYYGNKTFRVFAGLTNGLVTLYRNKLFCFSCWKNFCQHVSTLKNDHETPGVDELIATSTEDRAVPQSEKIICHSKAKIPYQPTSASVECFRNGIVEGNVQDLKLKPNITMCNCGLTLTSENSSEHGRNVMCFTNMHFGNATGNNIYTFQFT